MKEDTIITRQSGLPQLSEALQGVAGGLVVNEETITKVSGIVIDHTGQPLPYASVFLKAQNKHVQSDQAGRFVLEGKNLKGQQIVASCLGFQSVEQTITASGLTIQLGPPQMLGEVVITGYVRPKKQKPIPLIKQVIDTAFSRFSLYPNPIASSSVLTINTQKLEKGTYVISLINSGGEVVYNEQKKIEAKEQRLTLSLQSMAAGTYYVSLFNTKTAKSYSEKLIVE